MLRTILAAEAPADSTTINDFVEKIENTPPELMLQNIKKFLIEYLPRVAGVILLLIIGHAVIRGLTKGLRSMLRRSKVDPTLHNFIVSSIKIALYVLLIMFCLGVLNIFSAPLVTILGSVGLALSLAAKDSLANAAGGISVLFNHPFRKGDLVEIKGVTGVVQRIDLVYTLLITDDDQQVYLPNGDVSKSVVTNYSAEPLQRLELRFDLQPDTDFEAARTTALSVLNGCAELLQTPAPTIRLRADEAQHSVLLCRVWCRQSHAEQTKPVLQKEITGKLSALS